MGMRHQPCFRYGKYVIEIKADEFLVATGFVDIEIVDRNDWYRDEARRERDQLRGALYDGLASQVGIEFLEHEIDVWDKMIVAADQGQLRPTHLRCRKPG